MTNDLTKYANIFDAIPPLNQAAPDGQTMDFLGIVTAREFLQGVAQLPGGRALYQTELDEISAAAAPVLGGNRNGERWFECVNWITAAQEANARFTMVSLGAFYGHQAAGSERALRLLNPMPYKLVCVEPLAEKMAWVRRHMHSNGIDPAQQWLMEAAIGDSNKPVLFPVGSPTIGGHNCIATNEASARENYLRILLAEGRGEQALSDLLLRNSTGIIRDVTHGRNFMAEIQYVSCVTLGDVLGPFDFVDYIEADLQQSEIVVFPPWLDLLRQRVRRIHIGTHGADVHATLHRLFAESGWHIAFSYAPDGTYEAPAGSFTVGDGILTVRNPDL
jgi:hypothetical protein